MKKEIINSRHTIRKINSLEQYFKICKNTLNESANDKNQLRYNDK